MIAAGALLVVVAPVVSTPADTSAAATAGASNGALVFGVISTAGSNGGLRKASPVSGLDAVVVDRVNYEFVGDVSPDGNEIVYANGINGFNSLRIVGFDGSNDRQIVPAGFGLASASWKPDGSKILFKDADWFAWTVNPDGTSKTRVGTITGSDFRYSPDGTKIAYYGFSTGPWGLMLANADGSSPVMIHEYDGLGLGLDWSPDGGSIVFAALTDNVAQPPWWDCSWNTQQSDLFSINTDASGLVNLTDDDGGPFFAMEEAPTFSPDGTQIAYAYLGWTDCSDGVLETTSSDLYVIDADGTDARLVVDYTTPPDRIGSGAAIGWQACTASTSLCGVDYCAGSLATIKGADGGSTVNGTSGPDVIVGGTGADTIYGFGGNDMICAGEGNDFVDAGAGNDLAAGGAGDDEIHAGPGNDNVYGGFGNDDLFGDAGDDVIDAGPGFDFAFGGDGSDTLYGKDHADHLNGGAMADTVHGGNGWDTVAGGGGNDLTIGGGGSDVIYGGYGEDNIQGWGGDDTLLGGPADDLLNGGAGADTCDGGAGLNTYLSC